MRLSRTLRAAGLLLLGALALHWLRYWLAYGSQATSELHRQGHSYLADLVPALVAISVALCLGAVVLRLACPARFEALGASRLRASFVYAAALFTVFAAQELSEGALAHAHPEGLAGVFAQGGWLALPLGALFGIAFAWLQSWLERGEELVIALLVQPGPRRHSTSRLWVRTRACSTSMATLLLAFGFSRRPPPVLGLN